MLHVGDIREFYDSEFEDNESDMEGDATTLFKHEQSKLHGTPFCANLNMLGVHGLEIVENTEFEYIRRAHIMFDWMLGQQHGLVLLDLSFSEVTDERMLSLQHIGPLQTLILYDVTMLGDVKLAFKIIGTMKHLRFVRF